MPVAQHVLGLLRVIGALFGRSPQIPFPFFVLVFTGTSIARTFFIAATMFGAMSLYGYTTKRDLTQFSSFLIMGLIGVIIAAVGQSVPRLSRAAVSPFSVDRHLRLPGLTPGIRQTDQGSSMRKTIGPGYARQKMRSGRASFPLPDIFINIFQLLLQLHGAEREIGSIRQSGAEKKIRP